MTSSDHISVKQYSDGVTLIDAGFVREHLAATWWRLVQGSFLSRWAPIQAHRA